MKNRGFSMIEILIGMAIFATIAYLSGGVFEIYRQQDRLTANASEIIEIRDALVAIIRDENSWQQTIANNSGAGQAFECFPAGDCSAQDGTSAVFKPYQANNTFYQNVDPGVATEGYSTHGQRCTTFNAAAPDAACPFRFTFSRTIVCPSGPTAGGTCARPGVLVQVIFDQTVFNALSALNVKLFNTRISVLSPTIWKRGEARTVTPDSCAADEVVTQIRDNGSIVCTNWNSL